MSSAEQAEQCSAEIMPYRACPQSVTWSASDSGLTRVQMQNNGGVTIDPGTAGNLWNLARSAAQLYGRKLQEHTE